MIKSSKFIAGEETSPAKLILQGVLAFIALLSLRVRFEVGGGLETGNFLIDNLSKLANQFYYDGIADIFIFVGLYMMLGFAAKRVQKPEGWSLLLAFVFAVLYIISVVCRDIGNFSFFLANFYQAALSVFLIFGYTVIFYCVINAAFYLLEHQSCCGKTTIKHPVFWGALIIFIGWLPWLLMNYPCSFNGDSIGQLERALGLAAWSAHHPPFGTALMAVFVNLGKALWDVNFGCFLYVVFQSVTGAIIFSYGLSQLHKLGISRKIWVCMLLFFAISPYWGLFAHWFEKDFLYAQFFTLDLILFIPVLKDEYCSWKRALAIAIVTLIAVLLRKTGLYELIPALVLMVLALKKESRLKILCATCAALVLSSCANNVIYPALNIAAASEKEAFSIPFQQTARYVNQFPDEVTEAEREAIDAVLVYDELDLYTPEVSDPIKGNYREDSSALPEYFKHWFNMLLKHPVCYFEAAFMISYGYIAPTKVQLDAFIQSVYFPQADKLGVYRVFGDFPTRLFDSIRQMFIEFPLTNILCRAGFYTWILMICFVLLLKNKQYKALLLFVPGIMNILVCIASPLCASNRYELPVIASTFLIVGWTMINSKKHFEQ